MENEHPRLSVVIPAYNEADRIGPTLLTIDKYLSEQDYPYEILVVIDGAKDNTAEVVEGLQGTIENLRFLNNTENHGKGYVVRQGLLEARGTWRLFTDADNSTDISNVEKMWPLTEKGYKVVISSRDSKDAPGGGQTVKQPFPKRMVGNTSNILIQLVGVWGIWDTQNGFKMFHREAVEEIFSRAHIDRWGFDIEALALARKLDYKIGKVGIMWRNDPRSHVKLKGYLNTFVELFKIRLNLLTGKYDVSTSRKEEPTAGQHS
ncbi:MAG: dolichyl-phosphate beta-glucosyltransferase [Candidatus Spechtbacterales bacterium]